MTFWVLEEPRTHEFSRRRASWNEAVEPEYEAIRCPLHREHRRAGALLTAENVVLPSLEPYDFVWATWTCLVQRSVLTFLERHEFIGYEATRATVKFASSTKQAPTFWQLKANGYAGEPAKDSGSTLLTRCPGCGLTTRSKIKDPERLIDEARWDKSDFFRVEPFGSIIFIADRVAEALRNSSLKGWAVYSLDEMKEAFDIAFPGPSPAERAAPN